MGRYLQGRKTPIYNYFILIVNSENLCILYIDYFINTISSHWIWVEV